MSCWVAMSVAAELWGCTIDAVKSAINNGEVATREEAGWTFIDVAPDSPTMESPKTAIKMTQPAEVVSAAEMEALGVAASSESTQGGTELTDPFNFREARKSIETTRRAPMAQAA